MPRHVSWETVKGEMQERRAAALAADPPCTRHCNPPPCTRRPDDWTDDARCTRCGHGILAHPGHGGDTPHCLDCEYQAIYKEPPRPWPNPADNQELLDIIAMLVDQHCFSEETDDTDVYDSGALTANAAAMRVLAAAGKFRIHHQAGRRVIGELLREPPM